MEEPSRHHVHSSYIWLGSLRAAGMVLFIAIISSVSSVIGELFSAEYTDAEFSEAMFALAIVGGIVLLGFIVLLAIIVGIHAWAWRHLYYELGPEEFSLYSGIITKKRVHVPYQRIQSVDQRASLLQRIFGVCNLSIDTAGGASNKAIIVPYLTKQNADALRKELFARKQIAVSGLASTGVNVAANADVAEVESKAGIPSIADASVPAPDAASVVIVAEATTPASGSQANAASSGNILDAGEKVWQEVGGIFAGQAVEMEEVSYEFSLSNKELFFTGLSNSSGFIVALIVVIAAIGQLLSGIFDIVPMAGDAVVDTMVSTTTAIGIESAIGFGVVSLIGIALFVWVLSAIGACIQFGGFHARRRGGRIEVEYGLLQHQTQSVSIDRIQSMMVKQSFIRRIIGYCELSLGKIDAVGSREEANSNKNLSSTGMIIHPFLKVDRVSEIVAGLVPEYSDLPTEDQHLAKVALRRGLIRRCTWQSGGFWLAVFALAMIAFLKIALAYIPGAIESSEDMIVFYYLEMASYAAIFLGVVLMIIAAIGTVIWAKDSSFAINRRFMRVRNSGLSSESVTFLRSKIQFGFSKQNPLQRLAKTATINARTAAGIGGTTISLIDVSQEAAESYLEWLEPYR